MIIREVRSDDVLKLKDLLVDIGKFNRNGLSEEEAIENLKNMIFSNIKGQDHKLMVAEEGDKILGFIGLHILPYIILHGKPEGYISELFLRKTARGKGIGGLLLEKASEEAKRLGCLRLQLINFRDEESYARSFYAKHGWQERGNGADFVYDL